MPKALRACDAGELTDLTTQGWSLLRDLPDGRFLLQMSIKRVRSLAQIDREASRRIAAAGQRARRAQRDAIAYAEGEAEHAKKQVAEAERIARDRVRGMLHSLEQEKAVRLEAERATRSARSALDKLVERYEAAAEALVMDLMRLVEPESQIGRAAAVKLRAVLANHFGPDVREKVAAKLSAKLAQKAASVDPAAPDAAAPSSEATP